MEPPPPYSGPMGAQVNYQSGGAPPPPPGFVAPVTSVYPTVTRTTVIVQNGFGPYPMQVVCNNCNGNVMTETNASPGLLTWLLSGTLLLVGCWFGCCLIPCCVPECQDIEHRCPNCKMHLGTFRRL